ncbi:MAG: hypothetical protein O2968_19810 [Acidobacteria bacterium]|nr:hypothetical protein [Acidobacteriota bacterium]
MNKKLLSITTAMCLAALLSGCGIPAKITGGGSIVNMEGEKTASFGFNAQDCNDAADESTLFDGSGQLNYNDQSEGVKFHGEVREANQCIFDEEPGDLGLTCLFCAAVIADQELFGIDNIVEASQFLAEFEFKGIGMTYRSTNPKEKGEGLAGVCTVDLGEGSNNEGINGFTIVAIPPDSLGGGPFAGYSNVGAVQGNIQMHPCPGEGGIGNQEDPT